MQRIGLRDDLLYLGIQKWRRMLGWSSQIWAHLVLWRKEKEEEMKVQMEWEGRRIYLSQNWRHSILRVSAPHTQYPASSAVRSHTFFTERKGTKTLLVQLPLWWFRPGSNSSPSLSSLWCFLGQAVSPSEGPWVMLKPTTFPAFYSSGLHQQDSSS